ncbi:hypothetical protein I6N90_04170 [Paenibacillus sp. GSMTC-2017]|uniref:hypothetical protein n=1 Tax=Paenibacillus sp. GSMTC-2017 TaxID=2794350 RepID=UPI0018D8440F|nr:hypothetical protein [Paenibacillus sp. GSMTC-2017]MBH5317002.1 hypothetical protein [Paenibacillus sp. GSMTC-2017]
MNHTKKSELNKIILWFAASAFAIILTGCQSSASPNHKPLNNIEQTEQNKKSVRPEQSQLNANNTSNSTDPTTIPDRESTTETSNMQSKTSKNTAVDNITKAKNWSKVSPKLNGIAIGDSDSHVLDYCGKESDSYLLEEQEEAIQVLEYDGFAVGINTEGSVHFVEVYGSHVQSGLSGLKIGDHPEKVLSELGKPDSQSDYLLLYNALGAKIKLDVDPNMNEIVSIKLLAQG